MRRKTGKVSVMYGCFLGAKYETKKVQTFLATKYATKRSGGSFLARGCFTCGKRPAIIERRTQI